MYPSHVQYLVCPIDNQPLALRDDCEFDGEFVRNGALVSPSGRVYPIVNYIPRFTDESYAANFSLEWGAHPTIQHEASSGNTLYRRRFAEETKWEEDLSGQLVLEAGCGNGPLTAFALERGATVVSFDLSTAVDYARAAIGPNIRSLCVQASIYAMPFRRGTFDKCFCFGVIQHTPDPRRSFRALVDVLKPTGRIAVDCYIVADRSYEHGHTLLRAKYRFRKLKLNRLPNKILYFMIKRYVDVLWPLYRMAEKNKKYKPLMPKLMFDEYSYRLPGANPRLYKEFAILDIFDFISPSFDFPETVDGFRSYFEDSGLVNIDVHRGYNGIEGRGEKPADAPVSEPHVHDERVGAIASEQIVSTIASPRQRDSSMADLSNIGTEELANALACRIEKIPGNPIHDIFYNHGFHLLRKNCYLPIPESVEEKPSTMAGVDTNDAVALELMEQILPPYLQEFRFRFPIEGPSSPPGFYLLNGGYMAVDAHVYYGLIRHFKPRRIIEIGNGNSTMLSAAACEMNREQHGHVTELTSIDPQPFDIFRSPYPGLTTLIPSRVQDVPLDVFETLEENDILFVDSSHVICGGNDVHYEYLEIFPRLKPGVMVHLHDISLPKAYPKIYHDSQLYWNEQYLLQAFLSYNARFEVLWPGNYMDLTYPDRVALIFPELALMRQTYTSSEPTAFWMRVRSPATSSVAGVGAGSRRDEFGDITRLSLTTQLSSTPRSDTSQTRQCLTNALRLWRGSTAYQESAVNDAPAADCRRMGHTDAARGIELAWAGEIDEAIEAFGRHLRRHPDDTQVAYGLASCLACARRFGDADTIFSHQIEIPLDNGRFTNTKIITLQPGAQPLGELFSAVVPYQRRVQIDALGALAMQAVDFAYFVSCDAADAKLFVAALVRSIEANADVRIGVHVHLVNPEGETFRLLEELVDTSSIPIVISHETLTWSIPSKGSEKAHDSLSRFLILPQLMSLYRKPILVSCIDQIVVNSLRKLTAAAASYDAALLAFPFNVHNLIALFSASVLMVCPTAAGQVFAGTVRDYILDQLLRLNGGGVVLHIDQAALAVAVLRNADLNWFAIPWQALKPDAECPDSLNDIGDDILFWSITASTGENLQELSSNLRGHTGALDAAR